MISLALTLLLQDAFGSSAGLLSDVDGDSHADLIVTAIDGYRGARVWLVSGADLRVLVQFETSSQAGSPTICNVEGVDADFNGDGITDVLSHWYVPDEDRGSFETRILDAKDPRRVLLTWEGIARALGPDLDEDGLPDPTFMDGLGPGRWAVSQRGTDGALLWQWTFAAEYRDTELAWIPDASGDGVPDLVVVREHHREVLPAYLLDGATGKLLVESELLSVGGLWVTMAPSRMDWNGDGAGDLYLAVIDPRDPVRTENQVLLLSGADLSVQKTWKHSQVFPGSQNFIGHAMGYGLAVLRGPEGEETCLAGEFEYNIGRGCVVAIQGESVRVFDSEEQDSRSFGGLIRAGADWNGDGTDDYLVGCANNGNYVPDVGFIEIRDGRTHSSLLTVRLANLTSQNGGETDSEDD